jgi:uncharacterized protein YcbX
MSKLGRLRAIWRYPTKSLAAEPLTETRIDAHGLPGDRTSALIVQDGHARTGKPYRGKEHNLLHTTSSAALAAQLAKERGVTVQVARSEHDRFFDASPVSLIFDVWIGEVAAALEMPLDPRRWRPNLLAVAAAGFDRREEELLGERIAVGNALLRVTATIKRCVTPTYDIVSGEPEHDVLNFVAQRRANVMGVYCEVELAGTVRAGDPLRLRKR